MNKVYNFSPGPSKINEGVIKEVKKSIENYKDSGKSILEISHRSKDFEEILDGINQNFKNLFDLPNDFKILLLQGGATFQNSLLFFIECLSSVNARQPALERSCISTISLPS